jgi:ubiquinone/menaquinone biosynthesis C-methylase UbiE
MGGTIQEEVIMTEDSALKEQIAVRYAQEADTCCNLSCGGALDLAEVTPGEVLVDLGSGRGNDVLKAAEIVGSEGMAYGVDFTPRMIQVAEINRKKLGVNNAKFLEGEIHRIPLDDSSVDIVISNCTVNHAKDKAAVYRDIFRVLKPGGRFIISDILAENDLPEEVKNDPEAWAACYGGAIVKEEYFEAVRDGGFNELEILEESAPYEKGTVMVISMTLKGVKR